jgi:hypothetical protein
MELNIVVSHFNNSAVALINIIKAVWYSFKVKQVSNTKNSDHVSYIWYQIMSLAIHFPATNSAVIICLDIPRPTQKAIEAKLSSTNWNDSLAFHPILLSAIRDMYNTSVWALRDFIRAAERQRTFATPTSTVQPDFVHLHELARHVIHANEVLDVALNTTKRLQTRYLNLAAPPAAASDSETDLRDQFEYLENDLRAIKRRSESLHERLQNEIQLVRLPPPAFPLPHTHIITWNTGLQPRCSTRLSHHAFPLRVRALGQL